MDKSNGRSGTTTVRRAFLAPFKGEVAKHPPTWLMRQAGRYLPEYRATRTKAGGFLDLCYSPALATEVTLQPIRRYGFDAAILFSDILVVPDALGQGVRFVEGEGPRLDAIGTAAEVAALRPAGIATKLSIVWETVQRLRQDLPRETALIGFCGAPWTVATYMAEGRGSADQAAARKWAYRDPKTFGALIDVLVDSSIEYLSGQVKAGADAIQLFDTWAGSLPPAELEAWVTKPTARIVAGLRKKHPGLPILAFPRGVEGQRLVTFLHGAGLADKAHGSGVSLGTSVEPTVAVKELAAGGLGHVVTQGNLDPLALVAGGESLERAARSILEATRVRPHIFNLGHGIVPETPPENVARLLEIVRGG